MMLREILKDCEFIGDLRNEDVKKEIVKVTYDSRTVKNGSLFVAVKGAKYDGHDFIQDAIQKGASAVVCEYKYKGCSVSKQDETPYISFIKVKNSRKTLACISNNFFERPSEKLIVTGITGTNGKTTTTYILKSILDIWGKETGLIGTIQYMIKDSVFSAPHTTPESLEFQKLLQDMLVAGCTHVISEVSSHALAQYRVDRTLFKTAVFTNLTRDHLDFHTTMEDYFLAKKRLFFELLSRDGTAILNIDDSYGRRLNCELRAFSNEINSKIKILTCGIENSADIMATDIRNSFHGLRFKILFSKRKYDVLSSLIGLPNVYNILCAIGAAISLGVPFEHIIKGIENTKTVRGRFENIDVGQDFLCIVDYAHTEDALQRLIITARENLSPTYDPSASSSHAHFPRIITVFGCGGDRDSGKRPKMGEIATHLSDVVIITSDNPRSEDPLKIIRQIESGTVKKNYLIVPDRKDAIEKSIDMACAGDIVLIAGKGHEDYQEIKGVRYKFSDRQVAKSAIEKKLKQKG